MADQMKALESTTGCLSDYEKVLLDRLQQLKDWRTTQNVALELVQKFPEAMATDGYESPQTRVAFSLDSGTWNALMINKDCKSLQDVVEPLRFLREKLGAYIIQDDPDSKRRVYKFANGGHPVVFQAFFWGPETEQLCKFVEVGKEEKPIFKLMCGDQVVDEEVGEDVEVPG